MTQDAYSELGSRLKLVRKDFTQQAFADRLGTDKNTIGRYERGERLPDSAFLCRLHSLTGVSLDWLLTGSGQPPPFLERRKRAPAPVDEDLAAASAHGIAVIYQRYACALPPDELGRITARVLNRLMEIYTDAEERRIGLKLALSQVENDLMTNLRR